MVFLLWKIWKNRNMKVLALETIQEGDKLDFHQPSLPFLEVLLSAKHHLHDFLKTQEDNFYLNSEFVPSDSSAWCPPKRDFVKINFDAAINNKREYGTIATLDKNYDCIPLGWQSKHIPSILDPLILEILASKEVIFLAKTKQFSHIIVEGDSKSLMNTLLGRVNQQDIAGIFQFIKRNCNIRAHRLGSKVNWDDNFLCNIMIQVMYVSSLLLGL
ncbi:hypothetical protein MANES_15G129687v8 [Manihot esculenta]|uniref:Uncharacterized protein n=1 Tax=Manihot esculenta TaxID=3983 RepID=A0ACB7GB46_MANES|nr:hypothetical protein MANES_15G129687v8 [Manihot esculenta]